jgi:hypothetical protein
MTSNELINPNQFIRGLAALNGCLHAIESARSEELVPLSSGEMLSDALQYNLRSCVWSIQQLGAFIRRGAADQPPSAEQLKSVAWHQSFDAHIAIDHFLTCVRRVQDLAVGYIGKVLGRPLPSSMNDLVKRVERKPGELDAHLVRVITEYWNDNGAKVRDYRVLSEHHGQIATDCRFYADKTGSLSFFCGLPNNPSDKRAGDLSWEPAVDAYPYLRGELAALLSFVRQVVDDLLMHLSAKGIAPTGAVYSFRAPFYADQIGSPVPPENDIEELIRGANL